MFGGGLIASALCSGKKEKIIDEDDWQPPSWWIPVPEPNDYDVYMLIKAGDWVYDGMKASFRLYTEQSGSLTTGYDVSCDWGDGNEETLSRSESTHTYAEHGMYLVHIIGNENAYIWDGSFMKKNLLIFKAGEKIVCNINATGFATQNALSYVKINNPIGLNLNGDIPGRVFQQCYSLKKVSITSNVTTIYLRAFEVCRGLEQVNFPNCKTIGQYSFYSCTSLKTVSFPNVTSIGDNAFGGCFCLQKAYFPNCKSIGSQAFYDCNNLQEIIVPEDCTFGADCFQECYSLYPRPDGSTN